MDFNAIAAAIEVPDAVIDGIAKHSWTVFGPLVVPFDNALHTFLPGPIDIFEKSVTDNQHPLSLRLPLMTPTYAIFALFFYVVVAFALRLLTSVTGRLPINFIANIHNGFLFALSTYMCLGIGVTALASGFTLWNNPVGSNKDPNTWRLAKLLWVFYFSKLPEFMDTFIMIMKANYRQVTFLHVYHHTTIFVIWLYVTSGGPGGDAYWSAMLNSGVHVIMYGYYFLTSIFSDERSIIRKTLNKIKLYITQIQMLQFCLNVCQAVYDLYIVPKSKYPAYLITIMLVYMFTLLALFLNFYVNESARAAARRREAKAAAAASGSEARTSSPTGSSPTSASANASAARRARAKRED